MKLTIDLTGSEWRIAWREGQKRNPPITPEAWATSVLRRKIRTIIHNTRAGERT